MKHFLFLFFIVLSAYSDDARSFFSGRALVKKNNVWGYLYINGEFEEIEITGIK